MQRVLVVVFLLLAFPSAGLALSAPTPRSPDDGMTFEQVPAFGWTGVSGADHYSVQVASDTAFISPVGMGGSSSIDTRNTWATLKTALPNGTYYWRVRSVTRTGGVSAWSFASSFEIAWTSFATLRYPGDEGANVTYPATPILSWNPVPGAAKYNLIIASDQLLTTFEGHTASPISTDASSYSMLTSLTPGHTYYWAVSPINPQGYVGVQSATFSFTWQWNSETVTRLELRAPGPEMVEPRFSWDPIPGAVRYEIEINSDNGFAAGAKVCCTKTTVATAFSSSVLFPNNRYYWRVRGIDAAGHNGQWNKWVDPVTTDEFFRKTFDTRDPGDLTPAITNLRFVDNDGGFGLGDPATDADPGTLGYQTQVPIVTWDPVVGASAYEVETRLWTGSACTAPTAEYWDNLVATNAWTPLGPRVLQKPVPSAHAVAGDLPQLVAGHQYCVRVRAYTDDGIDESGLRKRVFGDWTYLDGGFANSGGNVISFDFLGYPDDPCTTCSVSAPVPDDYRLPEEGSATTRTPYFTWAPIFNAKSYFVLVSLDANFTTIIDYAFTREPAYAPRLSGGPQSYADETTSYYWAVLPAGDIGGTSAMVNALAASPRDFQKQSDPAELSLDGVLGTAWRPTFDWTPIEGARTYNLQVSTDPSFSDGNIVDDITTDQTSYTPITSYPGDATLYWRVAAHDWLNVAQRWSLPSTFSVSYPLVSPIASTINPLLELIPTWSWTRVEGAVSYDFELFSPGGTTVRNWSGWQSSAATFQKLDGTGVFAWSVRPEFPTSGTQTVAGKFFPLPNQVAQYTNQMVAPSNPANAGEGHGMLFAWTPVPGAARYQVDVSARQDFTGPRVERVLVDNPRYAPLLTAIGYQNGGQLYWQVAAIDDNRNVGKVSAPLSFMVPPKIKVQASAFLQKRKSSPLTITVTTVASSPVSGARVSVSGAGLRRSGKTRRNGKLTLKVLPRRTGKVTITVTKAGYQDAVTTIMVR